MTSPDPAAILAQINAAREQTYQNIALAQGILTQANQAAAAAAQDRAAIQAIAQQTVRVDTSVGTRVFAGDTMIFGDTGWRNLSGSLLNGWKAGRFLVRRIGTTVWLSIYNLDGREATDMNFCRLPSRLDNDGSGWGTVFGGKTIEATGGQVMFMRGGVGQLHFGGGHWVGPILVIDSAWPTSLPGTPA